MHKSLAPFLFPTPPICYAHGLTSVSLTFLTAGLSLPLMEKQEFGSKSFCICLCSKYSFLNIIPGRGQLSCSSKLLLICVNRFVLVCTLFILQHCTRGKGEHDTGVGLFTGREEKTALSDYEVTCHQGHFAMKCCGQYLC